MRVRGAAGVLAGRFHSCAALIVSHLDSPITGLSLYTAHNALLRDMSATSTWRPVSHLPVKNLYCQLKQIFVEILY